MYVKLFLLDIFFIRYICKFFMYIMGRYSFSLDDSKRRRKFLNFFDLLDDLDSSFFDRKKLRRLRFDER